MAILSRLSALRPVMDNLAPSFENWIAVAAPIPELAPVIYKYILSISYIFQVRNYVSPVINATFPFKVKRLDILLI